MHASPATGLLTVILFVAAATLAGCTAPQPVVREGSADSVQIDYSGDPGSALPLARRHCAQFERVPRLAEADGEIARFDCVRP